MQRDTARAALAGAIGGAVLSVGLVFAAAALGVFPQRDSHIRDYLMAHPEIMADMGNKLQEQQDAKETRSRQSAVEKLGLKSFFNPRVAFITGPANAHETFVEFFDYNCPYCRASVPTVKKFMATHKNARFAFIEFPIKGPESTVASRAAIAARKQPDKYLRLHFLLMNEKELVTEDTVQADARQAGLDLDKLKSDMQDPSIDTAIASAHRLAAAANVDGTPAFIINGHMHEGAVDDATMRQLEKF